MSDPAPVQRGRGFDAPGASMLRASPADVPIAIPRSAAPVAVPITIPKIVAPALMPAQHSSSSAAYPGTISLSNTRRNAEIVARQELSSGGGAEDAVAALRARLAAAAAAVASAPSSAPLAPPPQPSAATPAPAAHEHVSAAAAATDPPSDSSLAPPALVPLPVPSPAVPLPGLSGLGGFTLGAIAGVGATTSLQSPAGVTVNIGPLPASAAGLLGPGGIVSLLAAVRPTRLLVLLNALSDKDFPSTVALARRKEIAGGGGEEDEKEGDDQVGGGGEDGTANDGRPSSSSSALSAAAATTDGDDDEAGRQRKRARRRAADAAASGPVDVEAGYAANAAAILDLVADLVAEAQLHGPVVRAVVPLPRPGSELLEPRLALVRPAGAVGKVVGASGLLEDGKAGSGGAGGGADGGADAPKVVPSSAVDFYKQTMAKGGAGAGAGAGSGAGSGAGGMEGDGDGEGEGAGEGASSSGGKRQRTRGLGKVYLEFDSVVAATAAQRELAGRFFNGHILVTSFADERKFIRGDVAPLVPAAGGGGGAGGGGVGAADRFGRSLIMAGEAVAT
jgi:hypothetical protein